MDNNPLSPTTNDQDSASSRRRSTRIDYITTVLLSGKDAGGASYREFTQTAVVNLHGCKVRTSYRIMVGMLVTLECPKAGTSGKGVCVRVWDRPTGVAGHEIAVQLIKPQNLWGVTNPPADWESVAKAMVQRRGGQTEPPAQPAVLVAPSVPAPSVPTPVVAPRPPAAPPPVAPMAVPVAPVRPAPVAGATIDLRLAELERRATQLMESVLDIMRVQAEQLTRSCLEEFRQQVNALIQDSEDRLRENMKQSYEESADSLIGLRTDLMEQMASRGAKMIRSTEDILRAKLRNQLAADDKAVPEKPATPVTAK